MPETINGEDTPSEAQKENFLRRLDHQQWLSQFALSLETTPSQRGVPMTPFRAGAIGRLRLAAAYIVLLQNDARDYTFKIDELQREIDILKPAEGR